jgi:hypothetical protein
MAQMRTAEFATHLNAMKASAPLSAAAISIIAHETTSNASCLFFDFLSSFSSEFACSTAFFFNSAIDFTWETIAPKMNGNWATTLPRINMTAIEIGAVAQKKAPHASKPPATQHTAVTTHPHTCKIRLLSTSAFSSASPRAAWSALSTGALDIAQLLVEGAESASKFAAAEAGNRLQMCKREPIDMD